ncbi:hypothetical protein WJX84_000261 [Apatococcus fuscideae]|uniref:Uncharacterized protein n=1 Tax=Apatococcus fuscideae TaxID=2026836 RepID=A0AAW1SUU0_9CHLO
MLAGGDDLLSSAASAAGSRARGYPSPPTPPAAAQFGAASGHSPPASATAAAFPGLVNPSTSPSALSGSAALLKMLAPFFNPPYAQRIPAAPGTAAGEPQPQAQAPPVTSSAQFVIPASPDALAGALTQYFGASGSPVPSVSTQSALPGRHLRKLLDVQALDTGITLQSNVSSPEDLSEQLAGAVGSGHLEQSLRERGQNISSLQLISIDGLPYIQVPPPDIPFTGLPYYLQKAQRHI